jgi:hypothetical protein
VREVKEVFMNKSIDAKSFIIGFLLALVIGLLAGAGMSSGVAEVRIVGISCREALPVSLRDSTVKMELTDIRYNVELPVVIKNP